MSAQSLMNYNRKETARSAGGPVIVREEYAFLAAAKRGDSTAFEILCKQSEKKVFHMARRMMRNNEDAEDVVQESFHQAFVHLKSFNGDSRFSTWLSRIAINAALMKLRKKRHLRDVSLDESPEPEQPSSRIDVEDQGPRTDRLQCVRLERDKGGLHDDIFGSRRIGDFGISMFHGAGWFYRPEASSLSGQFAIGV